MGIVRTVYLQIGECIITKAPLVISTVLGSCVSATFFHAHSGFSAVFHAMLPIQPAQAADPCRYVDSAIALVAGKLDGEHINRATVSVKLFGGSSTIPALEHGKAGVIEVGAKNVEAARRGLATCGFGIDSEDTGGPFGRKILFSTRDGSVYVKRLGSVKETIKERCQ
jgi:chemotaxis protein CheD